MSKKRIVDAIALLFILLFVYTGVSKFLDFEYFKVTIEQAAILKPIAAVLQWSIPISEIIIAILLAISRHRLKGLYAALVLMVLFVAYVGGILSFNQHLPCSCGGVIEQMDWPTHLVFNIVFTFLALLGIWLERKGRKNQNNQYETLAYS